MLSGSAWKMYAGRTKSQSRSSGRPTAKTMTPVMQSSIVTAHRPPKQAILIGSWICRIAGGSLIPSITRQAKWVHMMWTSCCPTRSHIGLRLASSWCIWTARAPFESLQMCKRWRNSMASWLCPTQDRILTRTVWRISKWSRRGRTFLPRCRRAWSLSTQARRRTRFKGNPSSTEIEDVVESLSSKMESAPDADGPGVRRSLNRTCGDWREAW